MSTEIVVSLPDELLYDDLSTPVLNVTETADKLEHFGYQEVFLGGGLQLPGTKRSPGHESVASDVTMDSAIADMLGSPAGSVESGEENNGVVVSPGAPSGGDITTIDFDDMLDGGVDDTEDLLNYLLNDDDNNNESTSRGGGGVMAATTTGDVVVNYVKQGNISDNSMSVSSSPEPVLTPLLQPVQQFTRMSTRNAQQYSLNPAPVQQQQQSVPQASTSKASNVVLKVVVPKSAPGPKRQVKGKIEPEEDDELLEKNRKNAVQARLNRQKKKAYMEDLESKVSSLARENETLKKDSKKLAKDKSALQDEVAYLRSVLANQSALSGLLKNIENVQNVRLTTSFSRKRSADLDHDYGERPTTAKRAKRAGAAAVSAGVCLHVDKNDVSIEFCHHCARKSRGGDDDE